MLKLIKYHDVSEFKKESITFLEQNEVENNLPLGILHSLKPEQKPQLMATVKRDDEFVLVFLQTHPQQIIISKPSGISEKEIKLLAEQFCGDIQDIPGFIGDKAFILAFIDHMKELRDTQFHIHMNQRLYKLTHVKKEAGKDGKLRLFGREDASLIKEWIIKFCKDTGVEEINEEEAEEKTADIIEKGRLYGWEVNGEVVSMANASRPTNSNIHITLVYTPPEHRKKGYASSCVSALTQLMLDKGFQTTSLYTDLDYPTSNKIYMEIGYEPVMDAILVRAK